MNKKKLLLYLTPFILCSFTICIHKFYFSLTEIEYNTHKKTIQIITNVFTDDLEIAIDKSFNIKSNINNKNEFKNIDSTLYSYFKNHLKFKVNDRTVHYNYIGKETEGDLTFFYLEIEHITSLKSLEIENTLLINVFNNQQNLVKLKKEKQKKSLFLNKTKTKKRVSFY